MTEKEYKEKLAELKQDFNKKKLELDKKFCLSNNTVQIGDIVADNCDIIKVEEFIIDNYRELPGLVFRGPKLTKKLQPRKDGKIAVVRHIKNK